MDLKDMFDYVVDTLGKLDRCEEDGSQFVLPDGTSFRREVSFRF